MKAADQYKYMLHTWGGFFNEEFKNIHGQEPGYEFFDSMEELNKRLDYLKSIELSLSANYLAHDIKEGFDVLYRTIAKMNLIYKGKKYPYEYDFGFAYPIEAAEYIFEDGNYACDCNRSNFLHKRYPEVPEDLECGEEIEMEDFEVTLVKSDDFKKGVGK